MPQQRKRKGRCSDLQLGGKVSTTIIILRRMQYRPLRSRPPSPRCGIHQRIHKRTGSATTTAVPLYNEVLADSKPRTRGYEPTSSNPTFTCFRTVQIGTSTGWRSTRWCGWFQRRLPFSWIGHDTTTALIFTVFYIALVCYCCCGVMNGGMIWSRTTRAAVTCTAVS